MRKWIYIGLAFAFLGVVLLLTKCNDEPKVKVKDDYIPKKEQTIEVAKRNTLDSIALERAKDSIEILNNMIKNNIQKVKIIKVKSHEKASTVSTWSSAQYNEYLSDRYKDRK